MTPPSSFAAYVSNADSGEIRVVVVDRNAGTVHATQTLEAGANVMPMALSPDKRMLYAAVRSEPMRVVCLRVDAASGELKPAGSAPLPASMAYLSTDRTGRWLFAASYPGHLVSVSTIGADGVAVDPASITPTGKNAHAVIVDAGNRNAFVTALGTDQVLQLRFDANTGQLTPNGAFQVRSGAGPRHIVLHPDGRHAYLLNELDATLDLLAVDDGRLSLLKTWSTLPAGSSVKPWAADIHLTPDGKFLYTSERNSSTLAIWKVDAVNGEVTLVEHQPTETQPRGFQIDSSGRWLLAVGQTSHHLTVYRISPTSGHLDPVSRLPMGQNPNWIETVDLIRP